MAAQCKEKHNEENVTRVDKTKITSISNSNCGWRKLFRTERGDKRHEEPLKKIVKP